MVRVKRWDKRPESNRSKENKKLLERIRCIHNKSKEVYGSAKITKQINADNSKLVNHKRVEHIMRKNGIKSKVSRKFKATTNSNHKLPVAENILDRNFTANKPNEKMVSDITYLWTDEGWLYVVVIIDLYGQKVVGLSMNERMTIEWSLSTIWQAHRRNFTFR